MGEGCGSERGREERRGATTWDMYLWDHGRALLVPMAGGTLYIVV